MLHLPHCCPSGLPQHTIRRGSNRSDRCARDEDFATYAHCLNEYSVKFNVDIHAWVFMTHHDYLLSTPSTDNGIALMMQALKRWNIGMFNMLIPHIRDRRLYRRSDMN